MIHRVWEPAFEVWVVGSIHQDMRAEKIDHHLDHVLALGHFDAGEEPSPGDVVADLVLEVGDAAENILGLVVETTAPEREPAAAAFQDAEAQRLVALHDPGANKGADRAHRSPGMRRRAP